MPKDRRYTVEGYWDCSYCGTTGILGRSKFCPNCGHGRDASVQFYTKEIGEEHAITAEEFDRERDEARKNSRSSSVEHTTAREVTDGSPSLFSREEGQGRGDARGATDSSDWLCDFCGTYNPATVEICTGCGAAREMTDGQTYQKTQGTMARTYDAHGNLVKERDLSKPKPKVEAPKPTVSGSQGGKRGGCLPVIGVALVAILLFVGFYKLFLAPKPQDLTVASFDWERVIEVEQLQTVSDSGWELPSGARLDHTTEEVREYREVLDHYESVPYEVSEEVLDHYESYSTTVDNGDGTFDVEEHEEPVYRTEYHTEYREEPVYRREPIYATRYYYDIERWVHERDVTTKGSDHDPQWGDVKLSEATGNNGVGEEREGERSGTYGVTDSKGNRYTADESLWESLEEGQTIRVMVDSDGHITLKE